MPTLEHLTPKLCGSTIFSKKMQARIFHVKMDAT